MTTIQSGAVTNGAHTGAGKRSRTLDRTRAYMGDTLSFLVWGKETNGRINVLEVQAKEGNEPPPHYHVWENEVFYVLEGTIEVFLEGVEGGTTLGPNELVFIPQDCAHGIRFHSPYVRMLAIVQAAGDKPVTVDDYFVSMSQPAKTLDMDSTQSIYADIDLHEATKLAAQHGAIFLSPEETVRRLPDFPGIKATP